MILDEIVEHKKSEVESAKKNKPLDRIIANIEDADKARDFYGDCINKSGIKIICEIKKASPSKGLLSKNFHPVEIAKSYEHNGAFAISVLTDEKFFMGSLDYLSEVSKNVKIPVLRKDFTIDPYQIYEARCYGADIILLIASILDLSGIRAFQDIATSLGMSSIVEVHNEKELELALEAGSKIIGINNRDLKTFEVNLEVSEQLAGSIPEGVVVISESGIRDSGDIRRLEKAGITTFLIGETFMTGESPGRELKNLLNSL